MATKETQNNVFLISFNKIEKINFKTLLKPSKMYKLITPLVLSVILFTTSCSGGNLEAEKLKLEQEKLILEQEKLNFEKNKVLKTEKEEFEVPENIQQVSIVYNGKINGSNVLVRSDHSIQGKRKAVLKKDELVRIEDEYRPQANYGQAILRSSTPFYYEDSDIFAFKLGKGKAVRAIGDERNNQYTISFEDDKTGKMAYAKVSTNQLEFISGDVWYLITTSSGIKGWVFGKFIEKL